MEDASPTIFCSYSWKTRDIADKIYNDLTTVGIKVIKDSHELKYTDKISDFMKQIRKADYALLLISNSYLQSKSCMYEVLQLQKDEDSWNKVLPIITKEVKFSTPIDRIKYISYWQEQITNLELSLKSLDPIHTLASYEELKVFKEITQCMDSFLRNLSDRLYLSPEDLFKHNYEPLLEKMGVKANNSSLMNLLEIHLSKNMELRELELDKHIKKYGESSNYFIIKADTARHSKKYHQAKFLYQEALRLDPLVPEALNNLGFLYHYFDRNYDKAKEYYEKAINSNSSMAVPRLNLGVLLVDHFNDREGAREQYETVLSFDPDNVKALNNLANYHKFDAFTGNFGLYEKYVLRAIELDPNFIDARLNYGNYLKAVKKDIEGGNEQYRIAQKLDKEGAYKEIIDSMLKSVKG